MLDVIALGEVLIDFTPCGKSPAGMRLFEQNPGGAPANVLCALENLGMKTAFLGKVGRDMHGDFLRATLEEKGVNTEGLLSDSEVFTTLAFVELSDSGERSFSFARKPGADACLRAEELRQDLLKNTKIFHFGSVSLTEEPARSATLEGAKIAKEAGAVISYDPNYRALLWRDREEAVRQMRGALPLADVVKLSDEETELLTGYQSPEEASKAVLEGGASCVVVTLGGDGALVRAKDGIRRVATPPCKVVDTTGAGDSFWGGFLYKLVKSGVRPEEITCEMAADFARFANAVASLCVQKRGAIPAMPALAEAQALYDSMQP